MPGLSFMEMRAAAMTANQEFVLASLTEEDKAVLARRPATPTKSRQSPKKRTTPSTSGLDTPGSTPNSRRSSRIRNITEQVLEDEAEYVELGDSEEDEAGRMRGSPKRKRVGDPQRSVKGLSAPRPEPKHFGHQEGTDVGRCFVTRMAASQAGIHAPTVAGIRKVYRRLSRRDCSELMRLLLVATSDSVVGLSLSRAATRTISFTYTGSGGRDLTGTAKAPKNLRTAPQTSDQTFTLLNAALKKSVDTQNPVRVLRGYKGKSQFAPLEGYRYDGLYVVSKAWMAKGEAGFKVTRFQFERLPGQAAIPLQSETQQLLVEAREKRNAEDRARELAGDEAEGVADED